MWGYKALLPELRCGQFLIFGEVLLRLASICGKWLHRSSKITAFSAICSINGVWDKCCGVYHRCAFKLNVAGFAIDDRVCVKCVGFITGALPIQEKSMQRRKQDKGMQVHGGEKK